MLTIITITSCEKGIFADEELTLDKMPYLGNQLRINGYYYTTFSDVYIIYFLYSDGTLFSGGHIYKEDLVTYEKSYRDGSFWASHKDKRLYWGLYQINSNNIKIEKWYPSSEGGMPVYLHSGDILNDTTFVITKSVHSKTGEEKELNEIYWFKEFSPKPDSLNSLIR